MPTPRTTPRGRHHAPWFHLGRGLCAALEHLAAGVRRGRRIPDCRPLVPPRSSTTCASARAICFLEFASRTKGRGLWSERATKASKGGYRSSRLRPIRANTSNQKTTKSRSRRKVRRLCNVTSCVRIRSATSRPTGSGADHPPPSRGWQTLRRAWRWKSQTNWARRDHCFPALLEARTDW